MWYDSTISGHNGQSVALSPVLLSPTSQLAGADTVSHVLGAGADTRYAHHDQDQQQQHQRKVLSSNGDSISVMGASAGEAGPQVQFVLVIIHKPVEKRTSSFE